MTLGKFLKTSNLIKSRINEPQISGFFVFTVFCGFWYLIKGEPLSLSIYIGTCSPKSCRNLPTDRFPLFCSNWASSKPVLGSLIQAHAHTVGLHRSHFFQKSRYEKTGYESKTYLWSKGGKIIRKNSTLWSWEKKASHKKKALKQPHFCSEVTLSVPWQPGKREVTSPVESWRVLNYALS